jgi:hypothetical protein
MTSFYCGREPITLIEIPLTPPYQAPFAQSVDSNTLKLHVYTPLPGLLLLFFQGVSQVALYYPVRPDSLREIGVLGFSLQKLLQI